MCDDKTMARWEISVHDPSGQDYSWFKIAVPPEYGHVLWLPRTAAENLYKSLRRALYHEPSEAVDIQTGAD